MPQYYGPTMNNQTVNAYQRDYNYPQSNPNYLYGRIVHSGEDIRPNEVLPDGSPTYFPLSDRSGIIMREVTRNGTIQETFYSLTNPAVPMDPNEQWKSDMTKRIESLEKMVRRNRNHKPKNAKPNKEGDA